MRKIILIILIQSINIFAGDYGDAFIHASRPASMIGIGNNGVTQIKGIQSVLVNPAGLAEVKRTEFFMQYNNLFGMGYQHGTGMMFQYGNKYSIGATWNRVAINNLVERENIFDLELLERREYVRTHLGVGDIFSDTEDVIHLTLARNFTHIVNVGWAYDKFKIENPLGINIKLLSKSLYHGEGEAKGAGVDIGTKFIIPGREIFSMPKMGNIILGLNLENVYQTPIIWTNGHVDMAKMKLFSGIALQQPVRILDSELLILFENEKSKYESNYKYGFQWRFKDILDLRFGKDLLNYNIGFGLLLPLNKYHFKIDYSLENHSIETVHRISLTMLGRNRNENK
ncbi:MAG: hypothetical protein U9N76_08580 [Candidatus Marinimicrobia bacterium]|nr:hypothetical protein [Candidatus Neomarinimicrobiota bacterium]